MTFLRELWRHWPAFIVMGLSLFFYRGDMEPWVSVCYVMSVIFLVLIISHYTRKALFPYVKLETAWDKAMTHPVGAAVVYFSMMLFLITLVMVTVIFLKPSSAGAAEIPAAARPLLPVLRGAFEKHWPGAPMREVAAGQVEQESRWKVHAELKTSREYGFGLGQITKTASFDNFQAAQHIFKGWVWEDRFNPAFQLGYLVITDKGNFAQVKRLFADDRSRWAGALVAYNAGLGTVLQRRGVAIRTGAVHDRWFGGLDSVAMPYEKRLLYGRPLGQMRNDYPRLVLNIRAPKYQGQV